MNGPGTQAFLFPDVLASGNTQPGVASTQILLLQILHLAQQSSLTHNILIQQQQSLLSHSQKEFDNIKERLEEPKCEAKTTFDQFQQALQISPDICDTDDTINIQKQTIEDLQAHVQNYSQLIESIQKEVDSKTTINKILNNEVLDLQQQLENKMTQHGNISSQLFECKIKSNSYCLEAQTKFEVCEQEKATMVSGNYEYYYI